MRRERLDYHQRWRMRRIAKRLESAAIVFLVGAAAVAIYPSASARQAAALLGLIGCVLVGAHLDAKRRADGGFW